MATTAIGIRAADELDELYRTYAAEVFRYAYAVLGNRADAEDVTQTTFVNALRALERGERPRKPSNWLITIAHNLIRQRFRQQQSRPHEVELDRDVPAAEATEDSPSIDDLVRALQRIPPTQRQALVLRELEGRSYGEIAELLDVSQSALEALIFRARRSLAEELDNLVTCDRAEFALSRDSDGRLGRKERRRLLAHIEECPSCARVAAKSMKHRRAFKALAVLPLPFSLTLFKAPSAAAAAALPTIGAGAAVGTAASVGAAGVGTKIAIGLAAVAVAGGAGYEGVQAVREPAAPARSEEVLRVETTPPAVTRAAEPASARVAEVTPVIAKPVHAKPARSKPARVIAKQDRDKPSQAATPVRGRSAAAPGQLKTVTRATPANSAAKTKAAPNAKAETTPTPKRKPVVAPKAKKPQRLIPAVEPEQSRRADAPRRLPAVDAIEPKKPR